MVPYWNKEDGWNERARGERGREARRNDQLCSVNASHTVTQSLWHNWDLYDLLIYTLCSGDLFTHSAILSMCTLESTHLRSAPQFRDLCETKGPVDCCPGWNLGGYVALINNRSSCFGITVRRSKASL